MLNTPPPVTDPDTRFEILPSVTYELRGYPNHAKVAYIYEIGIEDGERKAFGVLKTHHPNGINTETCDWSMDGTFDPEGGPSGLDIVSAIGEHTGARKAAMVPLDGPAGFKGRLQEIVDQSASLDANGEPDDLLNALDRATSLADDMLAELVWSPPVSMPDALRERNELREAAKGQVFVARDLVEAVVCTLLVMEKTTNRVDDWRLDDMREELSANLIGNRRARPVSGVQS